MLEKELWTLFWRRWYVDIDSITENDGKEEDDDTAESVSRMIDAESLMRVTMSRSASVSSGKF